LISPLNDKLTYDSITNYLRKDIFFIVFSFNHVFKVKRVATVTLLKLEFVIHLLQKLAYQLIVKRYNLIDRQSVYKEGEK